MILKTTQNHARLALLWMLVVCISFYSCKEEKRPTQTLSENLSCSTTDNLLGKSYLDTKFINAIREIETSETKAASTKGMVLIKGGEFEMGGDIPSDTIGMPKSALPQGDEFPKHPVKVSDFYMDEHEVTIGQFLEFVNATGYKTVAEYDIDWEELKKQLPPNTPKPSEETLKAGAMLFRFAEKGSERNDLGNWWTFTVDINWKNPDGTNKDINTILNYPVTQIAWYDALAYAKWMGKRLPTEAEYEYAMRAGGQSTMYPWGNEMVTKTNKKGNFLQGDFPYSDDGLDGFIGVAPVKSFSPNAYGLYDIAGNVWEWTSDWYSPFYYRDLKSTNNVAYNPQGPEKSMEVQHSNAVNKVVRGGSFLCHDDWCSGYRNARRMRLTPDTGMQHVGFRLVRSAKENK